MKKIFGSFLLFSFLVGGSLFLQTPAVEAVSSSGLPKITSCTDLQAKVQSTDTYIRDKGIMRIDSTQEGDKGGGGGDYSRTNVQVDGVDEADIVKTNGDYIFIAKGNGIRVVKAVPSLAMEERSLLVGSDDQFYVQELYVSATRLVAIGQSMLPLRILKGDMYPYQTKQLSKMYIYDITDPLQIREMRHVAFEGMYQTSRKIGDVVYMVMQNSTWSWGVPRTDGELVPIMMDSQNNNQAEHVVPCSAISYMPDVQQTSFLVVAGIQTESVTDSIQKQVILGSAEQVYASKDNLYVTTIQNDMPIGIFNERFAPNIDEKTNIYKFALQQGTVSFVGQGQVPGHVLNQFSMDENKGNFRIATTKGWMWGETQEKPKNNVYVLDASLNTVGKLEGLAPGEQIYSVRFMGDRGYLVTFKNVDPLFVLDLADPTNPKVLGQLKIPGYSQYLHPYDENHLIGFGKDAIDVTPDDTFWRSVDFAWYQGIKIALFDVTDVAHPKEMHKVIIGDRGTDSPLMYDHKALLFDKEKNIFAFPITVAEIKDKSNLKGSEYGQTVFDGAFVYGISLTDGFTLKGKVAHYTPTTQTNPAVNVTGTVMPTYEIPESILRLLYINDTLYTVSQGKIGMWDLQSLQAKGSLFFLQNDNTPLQTTRYEYSQNIDFANGYVGVWESQTQPKDTKFNADNDEYFDVKSGDTVTVKAGFRNYGSNTWYADDASREVAIAVYKDPKVQSAPAGVGYDDPKSPNFGHSFFQSPTWVSNYRIGSIDQQEVKQSEVGNFTLSFTIPANTPPGQYREDITLSSGPYWIQNTINGDPLGAAHVWVGFEVR